MIKDLQIKIDNMEAFTILSIVSLVFMNIFTIYNVSFNVDNVFRYLLFNILVIYFITYTVINIMFDKILVETKVYQQKINKRIDDPTLEDLEVYETLIANQQIIEERLRKLDHCDNLKKKYDII